MQQIQMQSDNKFFGELETLKLSWDICKIWLEYDNMEILEKLGYEWCGYVN